MYLEKWDPSYLFISFWARTDIYDAPDLELGYYSQLYGLVVLRRDGFASMDAGGKAQLLTRQLPYTGEYLFVKVDSSRGGLKCKILDELI